MELRDHPDIESAIKTGYSRRSQPQPHYCDLCECELNEKDMYEDDFHNYLCKFCLLLIHKKEEW